MKTLNGNDLPHELLLTTKQNTRLKNAFNNNMSTDLKLFKAQINKIIQSGGFLGSLLSKLADESINESSNSFNKKCFRTNMHNSSSLSNRCRNSEKNTWLWNNNISNEETNDIMKIVPALEDSNILLKGVTKIIGNETKEQKGRFLSMLLGTLDAILLGNLLSGKGIVKAGSGNNKIKGIVRAGSGKQLDF